MAAPYPELVKRLQICLETESDEALGMESTRDGVSKAEIIRRLVADHLRREVDMDPIDALVGACDEDPGGVDDVVYGMPPASR